MCTVTFIPVNNIAVITSNRDEKHWRMPAVPPATYAMRTGNILFPKDADAGGTWFALHENGNAVVFLNGGLIKHDHQPPYRKSRGLVLVDIADQEYPYEQFLKTDLENIEPFTAVIFEEGKLFECIWDGKKKYQAAISAQLPHIWSSVTLYDEAIIRKREKWFEEWLQENPSPSQNDILHFHQFTGDGDQRNDLFMNRDGHVFTVSITSAAIKKDAAVMQYIDIRNLQTHQQAFAFTKATAAK